MRHALIVAGSLMAGLLCAAVLVMAVSADANEPVATGSLLLGFAVGWGLLAVLSARVTDRPEQGRRARCCDDDRAQARLYRRLVWVYARFELRLNVARWPLRLPLLAGLWHVDPQRSAPSDT
jgi:hypothetical protein